METEAHVRELTTAFLDAQGGQIVEELSERLQQLGSTALLPTHRALFDLVTAYVREPSNLHIIADVPRLLTGSDSRRDIQSIISGQIALWAILHRMLREMEGPHKDMGVIHAVLALAGDTVDGFIGVLIDIEQRIKQTEATDKIAEATDKRMGGGEASVAGGGASVAYGTLVELGRTHREFQMLRQIIHDLLDARDPAQMFEVLEEGILGAFHLRSLVIAAVNHEERFVEVVRAYPVYSVTRDPIGWRYGLSHPDILCDVVRAGRTEVIDGWDPRYHEQIVQPDGSIILRQHPRTFNAGQTAFFVPILARDCVIGVVCTASAQASKQIVLREIERMRPFLHQVGVILSTVSEIIKRKQVEEALRKSEERFRSLIEDSSDAIALINPDGTLLYASPATTRILGYAIEEFVGRNAFERIHPDDLQSATSLFAQFLQKPGDSAFCQFRYRHKDGSWRWIEGEGTNLLAEPSVQAIVANYRDITERRRAEEALRQTEEQLRQAQKMDVVGRFAGGIAHDFNNLLTVIMGYCELLLSRLGPGDPVRREIEEINKAGDRATALTRQLLAFSRSQLLQPKVLDLNAVVVDMSKMLRRLISEDIHLITVLGPGLGRVKVDRGQIEQVILNLAVNARDAMPQGGKLTIETENVELDEAYASRHVSVQPGPYVALTVTDTGCGMDAEILSHIFEPFFTTKEQGKGTGLGLATVYGVVTQSGGSISVSSEPGRGSTFKIYLPQVEEEVESLQPSTAPTRPPQGTETVLLVEDDEVVRTLVREILWRNGYIVLEARHGGQALQTCMHHPGPIHLMVTDVVMPGMNGCDLAGRLASLRPDTKVLYMSGHTDDAVVRRVMKEANEVFLQKPFTPDALAWKVREVLDAERR